jgi:hypothetical protein
MQKAVIYVPTKGPQFRALLERLAALGVVRVVFPPREYGSAQAKNERRDLYETARLLPRGDDAGFAERFLKNRRDT